ncbi:MAG TPA: DUF1295 domain-containing protein [Candidatus Saccharimonadaceae bacterium]|nr:DUF1295 domain-containing protein [Candidatus Saccharimonadaceae bacterium]
MVIWLSLTIALVINFLLFQVAFRRQSDKLTDFAYALSFIVVTLSAFSLSPHKTGASLVASILVLIWALRLGSFLVLRIRKSSHDKRFDEIRGNYFKFLKFWLGQGLVAWLLLLPLLFMLSRNSEWSWLVIVGVVVWAIGFIIETIADTQKYRFNSVTKNRGHWISSGIWHYSRHPNYFGEITIWVGMYIIAFSGLPLFEKLIGLVSPVAIFVTLRFISGVPILEKSADKKWGDDTSYKKYRDNTPLLIPWPHIK